MAGSPDYTHWVAKAEGDVAGVRVLAREDLVGFGNIIGFHCQQAAEKYLKACLRHAGVDFPKIHDFERLIRLCERLSPRFDDLGDPAARLQPYAVQARYTLHDPVESIVQQAIADVEVIRRFCRAHLNLGD